jgi:hypothetical protein
VGQPRVPQHDQADGERHHQVSNIHQPGEETAPRYSQGHQCADKRDSKREHKPAMSSEQTHPPLS